ncbi:transcriptional regulator [Bombiscardovia nodaiensis]|uniref:Transcriptional regulator n=1 Tax=Bombiscardovia nodaiensis TaxID=2932181 RepID=A0ABM8B9Q2_9BIFI|nr:transcriptional regulator [Bombiscardovia nodaiensis]
MGFRANLQYLRSQRHMTQEQLAMLVGVSRQAVSKWESEKAYPEMDKLLAICDLFGCTLDDLVLGDVRVPGSGDKRDSLPLGATGQASSAAASSTATAADSGAANYQVPPASNAMPYPVGASSVRPAAGPAANPSSAAGGEATSASPVPSFTQDVTGYDDLRRSYSWHIGAGCSAFLFGVAANVALAGNDYAPGRMTAATGLGLCCLMLGIVVGLALIIPANLRRMDFRTQHPYIEDFYVQTERSAAIHQLSVGLMVGIGSILLGVALGAAGQGIWHWSGASTGAAIVTAVGCGTFCIVTAGLRMSMINIDAYNRGAEVGEGDGENDSRLPRKWRAVGNAITGSIMSLATIIALSMLFTGNATNFFGLPVPFFLFWIIGGMLCGMVNMVLQACCTARN